MIREPRRHEHGYAVVWVLILLAFVGLVAMGVASMEPDAVIPPLVVAAFVAVGAVGLLIEHRYDRYEFYKNTSIMAGFAAAACLAVVASSFGFEDQPVALSGAVLLGLATLGLGVTAYRMSHAEEILPNLLLDVFEKSGIAELDGVQFASTHSDLAVPAGGELLVEVYAQNAMSEERSFEVRLKPRADIGKSGHLAFDKGVTLVLPGGAAGRISIPVAVHPKARGKYPITVEPKVTGSGGERWRVFRARAFSHKTSGGMQILALFFGMFVWGGGISLDLKVAKNKRWKEMPVEDAAPAETEIVYEPDRALMVRLAE